MAQAAASIARVAPATADIAAWKTKADRFAALGGSLIEIFQMSRLVTLTIEDAMEQPDFDGKKGLLFIDGMHRNTIVFAAQHLQDMIDDFRGQFFDIEDGATADNPRVGEVRDRDQR